MSELSDKHQPCTCLFEKQTNTGKQIKEEVIIDDGQYKLGYDRDMNTKSFQDACKTLEYEQETFN